MPASFYCPITHAIMSDPVVASDGFTYDRRAIEFWLNGGHRTSPMTNERLQHVYLVPNRTLRSEIVGGRTLVTLEPEDILELTRPTPVPAATSAAVPVRAPAPSAQALRMAGRGRALAPSLSAPAPGIAGRSAFSMPPQYEYFKLLIPDTEQFIYPIIVELAPSGWDFKSVSPRGPFGFPVAVFERALTAQEARGPAWTEYLFTVMCRDSEKILQVGSELQAEGWSYDRYIVKDTMATARFARRRAGHPPPPQDLARLTALIKNNIFRIEAHAKTMRDAGWSFDAITPIDDDMVKATYQRHFLARGGRVGVNYMYTSHVCENSTHAICQLAEELFAQGWGFDACERRGTSAVLKFTRPFRDDGTYDTFEPEGAQRPSWRGQAALRRHRP